MKLTFDEPEPGVTIVKLVHSDVPEEDRLVFLIIVLMIDNCFTIVKLVFLIIVHLLV